MEHDDFQRLEEACQSDGAGGVFDELIRSARDRKNHRALFGARVMQVRYLLNLPLIETEPVLDLAGAQRATYETAFREAAREAGELCLASGDILAAWPYFKALGEHAPVAAAIENVALDAPREDLDRVIEIAYQEGVNRRKGFELLLKHHGICSAITWFGSNPDYDTRQQCLRLLVRSLHGELAGALKQTIAATEGEAPESDSVAELTADRAWLFEGTSYYVDSTHLASILRLTPELEDAETRRMALEMAEYGRRLAPMFHFRGDPPFEDTYLDHAIYLRALLGEDVDDAVRHFYAKTSATGDPTAAEVLVELLVRLGRHAEAIEASIDLFPDPNAAPRSCPSVFQLCQMAGDYATLRKLARERQDPLGFAAALLQHPG